MTSAAPTRTGGHVAVETLLALGAETFFGLPGVHTLALWEGLRTHGARTRVFRTELTAGFAADGHARVTGSPTPLLVTTGPGALMTLGALMESAVTHTPVVAIASQVPRDLVGRGRGYLHELREQRASFEPIVKWTGRADTVESIPGLIAEAWQNAQAPPSGPVFLEIPVDVLNATAEGVPSEPPELTASRSMIPPSPLLAQAAEALRSSERPVVWAGGGVLRSGAWDELRAVAERLQAPVATTYMGKGALPDDHPLAVGSGCDERGFHELMASADVVLCVGTHLGGETTGYWKLQFGGQLIHLDAAPERIGASYPALGLVGDAKETLGALTELLPHRDGDAYGPAAVSDLRARIDRGLGAQGRDLERHLVDVIRAALPRDAVCSCDMTILGYWAAAHLPVLEPRRFLYPIGSGSLGYAFPAALGAVAARDNRALAIVGDGGIAYGLADLATARQYALPAALLLVDDGGYGILREYQLDAYGSSIGVDLVQPDFVRTAESMGVPARATSPDGLAQDLSWALAVDGPAVVVLRERLEMFDATP